MTDIAFEFDFMWLYISLGVAWVCAIWYTFAPISYWIVLILVTVITAVLFFSDGKGFSGLNKGSSELSHIQDKPVSKRQNEVNYKLDCHNTPEGFYDFGGELNICISKSFK